jgi:hypothetical protein
VDTLEYRTRLIVGKEGHDGSAVAWLLFGALLLAVKSLVRGGVSQRRQRCVHACIWDS